MARSNGLTESGAVRLVVIRDPGQLWSLEDDWNRILEEAGLHSPFLSLEWTALSFEYFGKEKECWFVQFEDEAGQTIGFAPLAITARDGYRLVQFATGPELTDYSDLVILPQYRRNAVAGLVRALKAEGLEERLSYDLSQIRGDSPTLLPLQQELGRAGYSVDDVIVGHELYFDLPGSPDGLLYSIRGKRKKSVARKIAKASRRGEAVELAMEPRSVSSAVDRYAALFAAVSEENRRFLTPEREAFIREALSLMAGKGLVRIYLSPGAEPVAGAVVLLCGNTCFLYSTAVLPSEPETGVSVFLRTVYDAIDAGICRYDFLRGEEDYKHHFGTKEKSIHRLTANLSSMERTAQRVRPSSEIALR